MGPLEGIRIIELTGIGPGPFCGMMLADMGAEVIRVERVVDKPRKSNDVLGRGRLSIAVDLKRPEGIETVLRLCESADAIYEGFRPGVTERLGLGPEHCMSRNQKIVYGRMTGWGQDGPMAQAAGHDINYISLSGALHGIGLPGSKPVPPLNLVGDFGGGGMFLAFGLVCGIMEAQKSGRGQVVDAAMVDGSATLMGMFFTMHAAGAFSAERGTNMLDSGAHFYNTYETADQKFISVGSIEPQFYSLLVEKTGLDAGAPQMDQSRWPEHRRSLEEIFKAKTRDEWCDIMEGSDVCFAPVLSLEEATRHPHALARDSFAELDGVIQQSPAPRFSRTSPELTHSARMSGQDSRGILERAGFEAADIDQLVAEGIVGAAE